MPDGKGNLYLSEAIELRNEYDRHIKLLQDLTVEANDKGDRFFQEVTVTKIRSHLLTSNRKNWRNG